MRSTGSQAKQYQELIGQRINELREEADLTQEDLAKRIGLSSASAIHYIEQGDRRVKLLDIIAIAKALDVHPNVILGDAYVIGKFNPDDPNSRILQPSRSGGESRFVGQAFTGLRTAVAN